MQYINHYDSCMGGITLGSDGEKLIGLWFDGCKYFKSTILEDSCSKNLPVFDETKKWLDLYFSKKIPDFIPEVKLTGSPFYTCVWNILRDIPYGRTVTYGHIAEIAAFKLNKIRMSAQAAGSAIGRNPVSIIIPCHRVIAKNGALTGYAGGIERKKKLLELEDAIL